MKTSIITPVGLSPPIATELVEYLAKGEGKYISDVVLLVTDNREVKKSAELIVSALESRYNIHTHWTELPFADATSTEEHITFMHKCVEAIKTERVDHGCDYLYLNVAGGRKNMSISLAMIGQLTEVDGIFHVVSPQIGVLNEKLERMRHEIEEHYVAQDLSQYYTQRKDMFDEIMFPPLDTYEVIQIPYIPYPRTQMRKVVSLIKNQKPVRKTEVDLGRADLNRLEKAGLLQTDRNKIYPTRLGLAIGEVLG